jgi:hypothetical protein
MESELGNALETTERHEAAYPELLAADPAPAEDIPTDGGLDRLVGQLHGWQQRLASAVELAAAVEQELNAREAEIDRWSGRFNDWRRLIQQQETAPVPPGPVPQPDG